MEDKMNNQWQFPINAQRGQSEGLNIHGINFFDDDPLLHLARENIQNSLDAANEDLNNPVEIKFTYKEIPVDQIPGYRGLEDAFKRCLNNEDQSDDDNNFFAQAKQLLQDGNIPVLTISDFNTKGLKGIKDDTEDWHRLVTKSGASNKNVGAGGAYGIGKNAPFACSILNTVFYSTINEHNEKGFQGVAKLASHKNKEKEETRGTGYFRNAEDGAPIKDLSYLKSFSQRMQIGTDIHIIGFKYQESWKDKVIKAVLDNFFVAISEGKVEITVEKENINKANLETLVKRYISDDKDLYTDEFLEAFMRKNENKYFFETIKLENIEGEIDLYIKEGDKNKSSRTVSRFRDFGMKIDELKGFPQRYYFSGVMVAKGKKLNDFLRKTEPPTHHKWVPELYKKDPEYANRVLTEIRRKIKDFVKQLSKKDLKNTVDIDGLADFLPDLSAIDKPFDELNETDPGNALPKSINIKEKKKNHRKTTLKKNLPVKRKNRKTEFQGKEKKQRQEKNFGSKSSLLKIDRIRARMNKEPGNYLITIYPNNNGKGYVDVKVVGEDTKTYNDSFNEVILKEENVPVKFNEKGQIGPLIFEKNTPISLEVSMKDKIRHSLEVTVYEN